MLLKNNGDRWGRSATGRLLPNVAVALCSLGLAVSAAAQDDEKVEEVVVVGTQIRGASTTEALPVTVIGREEIEISGASSADELFRTLPGVGAVGFGGNNQRSVSFGINGARGDVASINLRSLGEGNTLVLLNGRRLVDHPSTQTNEQTVPAVTVNMNTLPPMGIERIEVLRDGASAIYGSDAVAGVINTVLRKDYEGIEASVRYGSALGTNMDEKTFNLIGGLNFNGGRTNITGSFTFHDRAELKANERDYSKDADIRRLLVGTAFEGDAEFNNSSTSTPWALFRLPPSATANGPVTQNGEPITTASGAFMLVPESFGGCTTNIAAAPSDTCLNSRTSTPADLRFNTNGGRTMMPSVERTNFFGTVTHTFDNDFELYTELGLYKAVSQFNRADGGGGPLSTQPAHIPASNYWNPFGPITFSDGSANPNRLSGLDINQVPAEGLAIPYVSSLGAAYRILEKDGPIVNVKDESYRFLQGLRGNFGDWDFDTAFLYSEAETLDRTQDRLSLSLLMQQLALETPDAYNPWTGGGAYTNNFLDTTKNPASASDPFYISVDRYGRTTLALTDFKVSNGSLMELPGGSLGFAAGVEVRRQTYEDNRDPRLDGTAKFYNFVVDRTYPSDVMSSSDTPDTYGKRTVFSLFTEFAVPLVNPDMNIPLVDSLDLQVAARYEDYDDVGAVTKPRIAMSWHMTEWLQARASYEEGFRAPNLAQTSEPEISRQVQGEDIYFCQAQVNKGDLPNLAACDGAGVGNDYLTPVERVTSGSELLKPEESTSYSYGIVLQPAFVDNLIFTLDYWNIKQEGIIGIFGTPNHLKLDWAYRINNLPPNPDVLRAAPTADNIAFFAGSGLDPVGQVLRTNVPYFNLEDRQSSGIDLSVVYDMDTQALGSFSFGVNAAKLIETFQSVSGPGEFINAQNDPAVTVTAGGDLIEADQRPEWKGSAYARWRKGDWGAGAFVNYVGEFNDTGVRNDVTTEFWRVDSWTTVNLNADYRFSMGNFNDSVIRVGINNIMDEDPPLADENFNYMASLHNPYGRYAYVNLTLGLGQ